MGKKPSLGRQKIAIARIPKKNYLQVTFSKRRSGLFKKASELCTLCGVEIGIIVFSPASKVFSFGHPEVELIIDRFLARHHPPPPDTSAHHQLFEAHRNANFRELNMILTQVLDELEAERKRGEELDVMRKESRRQRWWEAPIDELGLCELEQLRMSMEEMKKNVMKLTSKLMADSSLPNGLPFSGVNNGLGLCDPFEDKVLQANGASTFSQIFNFHHESGLF
ncbi:agamous-like MADS-box protein AGL61 [Syzygium oleosum]|uniref:agamous-like MADS-box protein AGL61 n=1 Tax=Syzygium oleosum TaxID=219896 RepID=UPI0024BB8DB1|nr:agamous-like MADS-box protein AGL61 [Syzygium oleosum]